VNSPHPTAVLITDTRREPWPLIAAQWAALRGIKRLRLDLAEGDFPAHRLGGNVLLALSHRTLVSLSSKDSCALKAAVARGATLYVRGGFPCGVRCSLAPFGLGTFVVTSAASVDRYRMANHWLLPQVLRDEVTKAEAKLPGAELADSAAQVLAAAQVGGAELAFVFAVQCGSGIVIYDLLADEVPGGALTPIVRRLADPAARCFDLGALAAVNHATGRPSSTVGSCNLVIDDRPRDFDYFNVDRVTRWLSHIQDVCPGAHVDFAWTPQYTRPSARYISALKRFKTGFVWHGLYQHVDHRRLRDPAADHRQGSLLVEQIARCYDVRFQPIMILPFQNACPEVLLYLRDAGFDAAVFHAESRPGLNNRLPAYMHYSTPLHDLYLDYLPALRRYLAYELTREVMLANAALDLPIIAAAHPFEVGLRRFAALYDPGAPVSSHFDEILKFARDKHLRWLSLEEIAAEAVSFPGPTLEFGTNVESLDVAV
jgi:hypothetical protein